MSEAWNEIRVLVATYLFGWAAKVAPQGHPDGDDLWLTHIGWTGRCVKRERDRTGRRCNLHRFVKMLDDDHQAYMKCTECGHEAYL